jgi:hypothetical protein
MPKTEPYLQKGHSEYVDLVLPKVASHIRVSPSNQLDGHLQVILQKLAEFVRAAPSYLCS